MTTRYTRDHEWIRIEDGDIAAMGISEYAQDQLGDIVFVELPPVGKKLAKGEEAAVVESVKAASEVYAPVAGTIAEVNGALEGDPALVNTAPESGGWFVKLKVADPSALNALMDEAAYDAFIKSL